MKNNGLPVGTIRKRADGCWYIKVSDQPGINWNDRWQPLAKYVYEKAHHTKLKDDEHVIFLNGNHNCFTYENLVRVSDGEQAVMNVRHLYDNKAPAITLVGITEAKLINKTAAVGRRLLS